MSINDLKFMFNGDFYGLPRTKAKELAAESLLWSKAHFQKLIALVKDSLSIRKWTPVIPIWQPVTLRAKFKASVIDKLGDRSCWYETRLHPLNTRRTRKCIEMTLAYLALEAWGTSLCESRCVSEHA